MSMPMILYFMAYILEVIENIQLTFHPLWKVRFIPMNVVWIEILYCS